jgi:hypothetical protein
MHHKKIQLSARAKAANILTTKWASTHKKLTVFAARFFAGSLSRAYSRASAWAALSCS